MNDIGADNSPALRLDAGGDLFKKTLLAQPRELAIAKGMMDVYVAMGYDAVAVGAGDLATGIDLLKANGQMPWLSANLRDEQGKEVFPASVIIRRGDLRIGVIGLTGALPDNQIGLRLDDWRPLLTEAIKTLRGNSHLLVVLSNLTAADNDELVKNYPDIDLIITADDRRGNVVPQPERKPWLAQTLHQGKSLGVLTLFSQAPPSVPMNWEIRGTTVSLRITMPEDPAIADMVRRIEQAAANPDAAR